MHFKRNTGRTTRMIEEAKRLSDRGKSVVVVVRNHAHFPELGPNIRFMSSCSDKFDLQRLEVRGARSEVIILVDHAVIESDLRLPLEMLHRFDKDRQSFRPEFN